MYYLTHSSGNTEIHNFFKSTKAKVKGRLVFEVAYLNVTVYHVSMYPTVTPSYHKLDGQLTIKNLHITIKSLYIIRRFLILGENDCYIEKFSDD